mmetsp:Transcript_54969/g.147185  ORF Transcript_54969/g.147185 Transcript_54969/m.147185 type:complete len:372 (+) Transcript_54969:651-1766(+)
MHDLDKLDRATLHDLVKQQSWLEGVGLLLLVWLEAPDVVQVARAQSLEQALEVLGVPLTDGPERGFRLVHFRQGAHQGARRLANEPLALRKQAVVVLVQPALGVVVHRACVVLDGESLIQCRRNSTRECGRTTATQRPQLSQDLPTLRILGSLVRCLQAELLVAGATAGVRELTVLIEGAEDLADAIDHRLRVGKAEAIPRQTLPLVQALLGNQHVLHKVLLESLVGQVDAQLLEGVPLQPLKAIDIENTNMIPSTFGTSGVRWPQLAEGAIDVLYSAIEEPLVEGLDEAVQNLPKLRLRARHLVEGIPARDRDLLPPQCAGEVVYIHAQEPCSLLHAALIDLHCLAVVIILGNLTEPIVYWNLPQVDEPR